MITTKSANIDEFILNFPQNTQKLLQQIRMIIHDAAPGAEEKISYGIPTIYLSGNLVHFSAYKNHLGFYPGATALKEFANEFSKYETSKGTVKFPLDKNLPHLLITKIVKFRVKENLQKTKSKGK
jgi:uncharacterized protein YdhG (YjbR/CyaY superfamily)